MGQNPQPVRIFSDKIISAAGAFEDDMSDSPESTEAAEGHHLTLIGNVPGLHSKIRPADITVKQLTPSHNWIN
jgi:hypothetical protein